MYSHWELGKKIARGDSSLLHRAVYNVSFQKFRVAMAAAEEEEERANGERKSLSTVIPHDVSSKTTS
jgi:hypothetical protein